MVNIVVRFRWLSLNLHTLNPRNISQRKFLVGDDTKFVVGDTMPMPPTWTAYLFAKYVCYQKNVCTCVCKSMIDMHGASRYEQLRSGLIRGDAFLSESCNKNHYTTGSH